MSMNAGRKSGRRPFVTAALLAALALSAPRASAAPDGAEAPRIPPIISTVRVRLASLAGLTRITVTPSGDVKASRDDRMPIEISPGPQTIVAEGAAVRLEKLLATSIRIEAGSLAVGAGAGRRTYPGALAVTASGGRLVLVNECPFEEYIAGVLSAECPASFQPEALKAMAVAARSFSYRKAYLGKNDLCDTTHCQVYPGVARVRSSTAGAVCETAGLCGLFDGEVIDAVYSADCGGYTEANEDAWKGARPAPYLRPVEDAPEPQAEAYCAINRSHRWRLSLPLDRLRSLLGGALNALRVAVTNFTQSGRVRSLEVGPPPAGADGGPGSRPGLLRIFSGDQWRRLLGAAALKSTKFEVRETAAGIDLEGRGYGHGVGLCQFGAEGMARRGALFTEILKHYYTGIEVGPVPPSKRAP